MATHAATRNLSGLARALAQHGLLPEAEADALQQQAQSSGVTFVEQVLTSKRFSAQQVAVALQREINDGVEQWVAGTDKGRQRLAGWGDEVLLEGDPFVAVEHGLAGADQPVALAYDRRDVGHLVTARLPLPHGTPKPTEALEEKGLDVVGLEAAGLGALHVLPDALHAASVHGVMS